MTVLETLGWANHFLREQWGEKGLFLPNDVPMLDVEILLSAAIGVPKSWLFTHFSQELRPHEDEKFRALLKRRSCREPVAYLVREKEFFKRPFFVNPFVLIPRPDTEALAEEAIHLGKNIDGETALMADIGTGSGALAITLASETRLPVIATDIDRRALVVAEKNARRHGVSDRIVFRQGDLFLPISHLLAAQRKRADQDSSLSFFLLCANLPYLPTHVWEDAPADVRLFEPLCALTAGPDGLDAYWRLFKQLGSFRSLLPETVFLLLEMETQQKEVAFQILSRRFPLDIVQRHEELETKNSRLFVAEIQRTSQDVSPSP